MKAGAPLSSDYMAALADVESRFPVAEWRAGGVALWPMLRVRWVFDEIASNAAASDGQVHASTAKRIYRRLREMIRAYVPLAGDALVYREGRDRGPAERDLLFLSDGLTFARLGEQWLERLCDPIIARAARQGLRSALWTPLYGVRRPRVTPSRFVQLRVDLASIMAISWGRFRPAEVELPQHDRVLALLVQRGFGVASLERSKIIRDAARLRAITQFYRRELARVRPRLAFIVSYYSLEGFGFVLACHEQNIRVVELQHGVQGDLHPAYGAWPPPLGGKHELLPDVFWVWSDWESKVIERWALGTRHRAFAAGNPWLDVWRDDTIWPGVAATKRAALDLKARAAGRPVVLVTLQYGLPATVQFEPLARLIQSEGQVFQFWVRLHPMMLSERDKVRGLLGTGDHLNLDEPTDLSLHALLPHADVHLTHSSSTVIEAAQFGVRSVITSNWGAELYCALIDAGWAVVETGESAAVRATCERLIAAREHAVAAPTIEIDAALKELLHGART